MHRVYQWCYVEWTEVIGLPSPSVHWGEFSMKHIFGACLVIRLIDGSRRKPTGLFIIQVTSDFIVSHF